MKKISLILIILFSNCCHEHIPDDPCKDYIDHVYIYPPYHCKDSIDCIDSFNKNIELRKIPENYLICSSTDSLVQTCLNYPNFMLIWVYTSLQQGFDNVRNYCNGFNELYSRNDLNMKLIKSYQIMKPDIVTTMSDTLEIGYEMEKFTFIEITIAQYNYLNKLSNSVSILLLEECIKKYEEKTRIPSYGLIGEMTVLAIMVRIMYINNYMPFMDGMTNLQNLHDFIDFADLFGIDNYKEIMDFVILNSRNYLKELKK